jgi:hypothetical protein
LLNVRFGSLLGPRGLLLMYMWGENSVRENPVIRLPAFWDSPTTNNYRKAIISYI